MKKNLKFGVLAVLAAVVLSSFAGIAGTPSKMAAVPSPVPSALDATEIPLVAVNQTAFGYNFYMENKTGFRVASYYGANATIVAQYNDTTSGDLLGFVDSGNDYPDTDYNITFVVGTTVFHDRLVPVDLSIGDNFTFNTGLVAQQIGMPLPVGSYQFVVNFSDPSADPISQAGTLDVFPCPVSVEVTGLSQGGEGVVYLGAPKNRYQVENDTAPIDFHVRVTNLLNSTRVGGQVVVLDNGTESVGTSTYDGNGNYTVTVDPATLARNSSVTFFAALADGNYTGSSVIFKVYVVQMGSPALPAEFMLWIYVGIIAAASVAILAIVLYYNRKNAAPSRKGGELVNCDKFPESDPAYKKCLKENASKSGSKR